MTSSDQDERPGRKLAATGGRPLSMVRYLEERFIELGDVRQVAA
jgi:hypothetical protein